MLPEKFGSVDPLGFLYIGNARGQPFFFFMLAEILVSGDFLNFFLDFFAPKRVDPWGSL